MSGDEEDDLWFKPKDDYIKELKDTISELRLELLIVLGYMESGVPWWYGSSIKERIRSVLWKGEQDDSAEPRK